MILDDKIKSHEIAIMTLLSEVLISKNSAEKGLVFGSLSNMSPRFGIQ